MFYQSALQAARGPKTLPLRAAARALKVLSMAAVLLIGASLPLGAASFAKPQTTSSTISFFSKALDCQTTYAAFYPTAMEPGRRYPVVYLLHGAYGGYLDWPKTPLAKVLDGRPMIVITPDGGQFGWYLDSPRIKNSNYESFVTRELVAEVDGRFPTVKAREGRAIAGLSMGGHGALSLAARHPDLFGSASSMSGILCLTNHPGKWHLDDTLGKLPEALNTWKEHSVYDLAERYTSAGVTILFDTGTSDTTGAVEDNRQLHELLSEKGIAHTYLEFPGAHTWEYWNRHVVEHLAFHEACFNGKNNSQPQKGAKNSKESKEGR